jgi:hypothetical protein
MDILALKSNRYLQLIKRTGKGPIPRSIGILTIVWSLVFILSGISFAQLSPGDLHESHSFLEGLRNCEECHEAGKRISPSKCLECHTLLAKRIGENRGLHAGEGFEDCTSCHVEHLGRDAELIWWPEGMQNFDHLKTGYELRGKHETLDCRKCHAEKNITDKGALRSREKNLARTFLGLSSDCLSCHADEHRGQLRIDCSQCHSFDSWKSVPGFDHDKTDFKLTGRHREALCQKCHTVIVDGRSADDPDYVSFTKIEHSECLNCHQIYHKSGFDRDCTKCHTTAGWNILDRSEFSHANTRFPLLGKHLSVACDKCHKPGQPFYGLNFSKCTDCHKDYHRGQFGARESKGECDECHNVDGFIPAKFDVEAHQKTDYPLEGSHLAIPCVACHKSAEFDDGLVGPKFVFKSTRCRDCHADPHKGQVDKYTSQGGCEYCHKVESWAAVTFDHQITGFKLDGRHAVTSCKSCHKSGETTNVSKEIGFQGLSSDCSSCHRDIHAGQFAIMIEDEPKVDCRRCHTPADWKPGNFDHNRDAAFKLEGAHVGIPCRGCHKQVTKAEESFILYKPLGSACENCHDTRQSPK